MDTKDKVLIQATSLHSGNNIGLYLLPDQNIDLFEEEFLRFEDQNDFDSFNDIDAERIIVEENLIIDR